LLDPQLSVQANAGAHFIFKRHFWSHSYTQHAWTASSPSGLPKGVISFVGGPWLDGCDTGLCALIRSTSNRPMLADVIAGGNITSQFYPSSGAKPANPLLGSSIRTATFPDGFLGASLGVTILANGNLGVFSSGQTVDLGVSDITSAPVLADHVFAQIFYTVGAQRTLYYTNVDAAPEWLALNLAP
jgi:hypothetical protein